MQLERNKWYKGEYAKHLTVSTICNIELYGDSLSFGVYDAENKKFASWVSGEAGELNDEEVTAFFIPEENKLSH